MKKPGSHFGRRRVLLVAVAAVALLLVILYQAGVFRFGRVKPGTTARPEPMPSGERTFTAQLSTIPRVYTAVGAVRSRDEVEISPRIIARVLEVKVRSGDAVHKGQELIVLDSADLEAVVQQAREGVAAARAALDPARKEEGRVRKLHDQGIVPRSELDQAESTRKQAEAARAAAEQRLREAEAGLGYARITSPMDGIVAERNIDVGDLASPGNILLKLFDPKRLMLEAPVRESLASKVAVDMDVHFAVPALGKRIAGKVEEVVPSVDPGSRTFLVKVCIDEEQDLMPGMFGTLMLVLGTEEALLIPEAAVRRTGQVQYVSAIVNGRRKRLMVRSIPARDAMVRVHSGLEPGTAIILPEK